MRVDYILAIGTIAAISIAMLISSTLKDKPQPTKSCKIVFAKHRLTVFDENNTMIYEVPVHDENDSVIIQIPE